MEWYSEICRCRAKYLVVFLRATAVRHEVKKHMCDGKRLENYSEPPGRRGKPDSADGAMRPVLA